MRHTILALAITAAAVPAAHAQVNYGIGVQLPGISIGVSMPSYPALQPIPGLPVYYAPRASLNYFYYDGLFWVYRGDDWYASTWYDGPWHRVWPYDVPDFVLRVPVRYYGQPPMAFRGWRPDAPPRWVDQWGRDWGQRRAGWDRWDHHAMPTPAPLPEYQRAFPHDRYPGSEDRQREIRTQQFRYQPREAVGRHQYEDRPQAHAPVERQAQPPQGADPRRMNAPQAQPRNESRRETRPDPRPASRQDLRQDPRQDPRQDRRSGDRRQGDDNSQGR